jgi:hypothetical protein
VVVWMPGPLLAQKVTVRLAGLSARGALSCLWTPGRGSPGTGGRSPQIRPELDLGVFARPLVLSAYFSGHGSMINGNTLS